MLTHMTKGLQITIPAKFRNILGINENTMLDIELDRNRRRVIIEPIEKISLEKLFRECDKVKIKSKKSIKQMEEEYARENLLH